jgi:hypothetical protein
MVAARFALGWFGLIVILIALIVLSIAEHTWYVTFMQSVMLICLVFVGLVLKNETARVT